MEGLHNSSREANISFCMSDVVFWNLVQTRTTRKAIGTRQQTRLISVRCTDYFDGKREHVRRYNQSDAGDLL